MCWRKVVLYCVVAALFGCVSAQGAGCRGRSNPLTSRYVTVNYTIWDQLGDDPANFSANIEVTIIKGATFYQVMQLAELADDTFRFESQPFTGHPGLVGHFIVSIDGRMHVPADQIYWFIYQTPGAPDPSNPPGNDLLTKAVDYILVNDGDNYLFWRRKSTGIHDEVVANPDITNSQTVDSSKLEQAKQIGKNPDVLKPIDQSSVFEQAKQIGKNPDVLRPIDQSSLFNKAKLNTVQGITIEEISNVFKFQPKDQTLMFEKTKQIATEDKMKNPDMNLDIRN